ncbi:MAG: hypothetical protein R3200_08460 [Xanthomonadales bacterium]|nr:hypothetical protein [Xanthomonadales bacterium]
MAIAGGAAWLSYGAPAGPLVAIWATCLGVIMTAPALGEKLGGTPGWLFALLALATGALGIMLFPEHAHAGLVGGGGLIIGAGVGTRSKIFRLPALVVGLAWALTLAGIWLAGMIPMWHALFALATLPVGILLGFIFMAVAGLDAGTDVTDPESLLVMAREAMESFDLERARKLLARAAALAPDDREIIEARYAAWKYDPTDEEFHEVASDLLQIKDIEFVTRYYRDYLAVTQVRPQLDPKLHLELARRFAQAGNPDDSARIVNLYLQRDPNTAELPESLLAVSESYAAQDNRSKAVRYAESLVALYPHSEAARPALEMLDELRPEELGAANSPTRKRPPES